MKKISKLLLAFCSMLLCLSTISAGNPTTFVGPTVRGGFTAPITESTAYSVAGEVGVRDYRVGGTLGWRIVDNQRIKLTAEYLWQKIGYSFFTGDTRQWVNQGAIGADYQYEFLGCNYKPQIDLSAYYSHANSKTLSTRTGTTVINGTVFNFTDFRRIAGSNAVGVSPGVTVQPWMGGVVGVDLNYDNVRYNTRYNTRNDATGFGGTIRLGQAITDCVGVGVSAAVRKPFNDYQGNVSWSNVPFFGNWVVGLFGGYVVGKEALPNTWNVGLNFNYIMEPIAPAARVSLKGDLKGEGMLPRPSPDDFLAWTADPAVHMPQVLAITDERVELDPVPVLCPPGSAPLLTSTIPTQAFGTVLVGTFNVASHFSGSNLTFTATTTAPGVTVTVTPSGVVTVTVPTIAFRTVPVTITATNSCGSAIGPVTVTFRGIT